MNLLVCGAGGFIGGHLVNSLKTQGHQVVGVDIKQHEYQTSTADVFYELDLRNQDQVLDLFKRHKFDGVYQLSANMGGAGYIFTGEHDADILADSAMINLNIVRAMREYNVTQILYTSSACIYPESQQLDALQASLRESQAYPASPDSEYGWEKLFAERLYLSHARCLGWRVRIARLHNVFGPYGAWNNGREKAPAALCRKVAECPDGGTIDVWGPGTQTRSFLYIDQCIEGLHRLWNSDYTGALNLGSERMISINDLVGIIAGIAGKTIAINNIPGPAGVPARNSDNTMIRQVLGWEPKENLEYGLTETYQWIKEQL